MTPAAGRPPARFPDWPERLAAYIERCAGEPWGWGERDRDCCLFAGGAVEAVTGRHPCGWLVGLYGDEAGAAAAVEGAGGLVHAVTTALGTTTLSARLAQRADVALIQLGDGSSRLGVVLGEMIAVKGDPGVALLRAARALLAWPVGR